MTSIDDELMKIVLDGLRILYVRTAVIGGLFIAVVWLNM
jgi:hypothetical protein